MDEADVVRLDLPGSHRYLNLLGACVAQFLARADDLADPAGLIYQVQLALHETCTNIVEHAYEGRHEGRIQVSMMLRGRCLTVEIHDTGKPFDLDGAETPSLDEPQIHGYGLFLIQQLMDEVVYTPKPGDNRWRLVKYL
jgi:serine/threonine-protein kinase RsbW